MSTTKRLYDECVAASWIRLLFGALLMVILLT